MTPIRPRLAMPGLPVPLTRLIGREREVAAVVRLLQEDDVRVLTLTGPGGVGKTRLALQAATDLGGVFADGIGFVSLASIHDADLFVFAVAQALGLQDLGCCPVFDRLVAHLRHYDMLLVLDNFEQLLTATPCLARMLGRCPRLKLLVTSRTVLHLSGEHDLPVPPLTLPMSPKPTVDEVNASEAVRLFLARARASRPDFALTETNASAVAAVTRRLEGLPLAIELAAARVAHLPLTALLHRLEQRLVLLTGGPRDWPDRLRTMRDAIAWSYKLLSPQEQTLFRRLSVFAGGCTLGAAVSVAGVEGDPEAAILDGIAALVDASLLQVVAEADEEPRYLMLETIREYGWEQLVASGEVDTLRSRHVDFFLALARSAAAALASSPQGEWLARLEAEQANVRAALIWLRDQQESETGLALAAALGSFWHIRSANAEGRAWIETFLMQAPGSARATSDRIAALRWAGELAGLQGNLSAAKAHLGESLSLARQVGERRGVAAALRALGSAMVQQGDIAGSLAPLAEAVALTRELGDLRQTGFLLAYLAYAVGQQGDLTQAEALAGESEALLRSVGNTVNFEANFMEFVQGWLAVMSGDYDRAQSRFETAITIGQAIAAKGVLSAAHQGLGEVAMVRGDMAAAAQHYREGLILGWEGEFPVGIGFNLQGLVRVACSGEPHALARVIGALDTFAGAMQALPRLVIDKYEAAVATVRTTLGEEAFMAARVAGQAIPLETVISEVLALPAGSVVPVAETSATIGSFGLSPRQIEVLRMVAAGYSDQTIAETLFVSRRTINTHVASILDKLGVHSRSAAVALAVRRGLV